MTCYEFRMKNSFMLCQSINWSIFENFVPDAMKGNPMVAGEIVCEKLCKHKCAFAISSSGDRCILEKQVRRTGEDKYVCKTSDIQASGLKNWIETNECVEACGLERTSLGISSDSLLESSFTGKLCSTQCHNNCPNIVDLYFNLAAGEGVFLPKLCEQRGETARRRMTEMKSSGFVAPGPDSSMNVDGFMMHPHL
ncbi:unnamed protein product [Rhodiola kirilowii]